jgi:subtilisin family serine protease
MSNPDDPTTATPDVRWWRPVLPNDTQRARYRDQLELMIQGLTAQLQSDADGGPDGGPGPGRGASATIAPYPDTGDLADTEFLYRSDTILVSARDADLDEVADALGTSRESLDSLSLTGSPDANRLPPAVDWLRVLPVPMNGSWAPDSPDTPETPRTLAEAALARIEERTGRSDLAGFDRVVHLAPGSNSGCPATEPVPFETGPDPKVCEDTTLGDGVHVAVIDSGWPLEKDPKAKDARPKPASSQRWSWLNGVEVGSEPEAAQPGTSAQAVQHGHYRGHGIFVAGVIRSMAPAAKVTVHAWGPSTYGQIESELAPILQRVLDTKPHIISMSAGVGGGGEGAVPGAKLRDGRRRVAASVQPARALQEFLVRLASTDTLLVCAAGNDGAQGPFEPASTPMPVTHLPRCKVAVGALKKNGRLAKYSNRGPWVDVYARGSKVVNAYPYGPYTYTESPRSDHEPKTVEFDTGLAQWSGTSFATPLVAGLVAARMSWDGFTGGPRQAWEELARLAVLRQPFGLPTLAPGDADRPAP